MASLVIQQLDRKLVYADTGETFRAELEELKTDIRISASQQGLQRTAFAQMVD